MLTPRFPISMFVLGAVASPLIAGTTVYTDRDYMTSGFFSMDPAVRGDNDGRAVNRVSTIQPFGVFNENTYLEFNDFDWGALGGPVESAVFRIEVVSGGFGADSDSENPFLISAHSLTQDPWTTIDPSLFSGAGSYQDFASSHINTGSVVSNTSVAGAGVYEWDLTALVNDWILNGDANYAQTIALSGILDTSGGTFLQGVVNSTNPGLTGSETIGQIVIVPTPAGMISFAAFGVIASRRRRS